MLKILNFRTLAKNAENKEGKKIKPNTIFRSGAISYAAKIDLMRLKSYGVCDIYDFRSQKEVSHMPQLNDPHFKTHHFDILEEAANSNTKSYLNMTREQLNARATAMYSDDFGNTEGYKGAIANIAAQTNPEFLFHCTAGKDRTGIFGAIIMMILDFDMDTIKKEYITIDKKAMKLLGRKMLKREGISPKNIDESKFEGIMGVLPEFIDAYYNTVFENHSSIDEYLLEKVGVTNEIKKEFKNRYLI